MSSSNGTTASEEAGGGAPVRGRRKAFLRRPGVATVAAIAAMALVSGSVYAYGVITAKNVHAATSASQQWVTDISAPTSEQPVSGATRTYTFGSTGVVATERTTSVSNYCRMQGNSVFSGANLTSFVTPTPPTGVPGAGMECFGDQNGSGIRISSNRISTITFNKPVTTPILHVMNLDASWLQVSGTSTTGAAITITPLKRNNALEVDTAQKKLNATPQQAINNGCAANDGTNENGGCGSVQLSAASGAIQQFTLKNATNEPSSLTSNDGWALTMSFPTAQLTKAFSPSTIEVGQTSDLTFSIANPANEAQSTLTPLDFTDALPSGLTIADGTVTNNGSCGSPTLTGPGGAKLAAGATSVAAGNITVAVGATCTITVHVTSNRGGTYTNASANLSTTVVNLLPNANATLRVSSPSLSVAKTASRPSVTAAGQTVTYTFLVTNTGDATLKNVKINETGFTGSGKLSATTCQSGAASLAPNATVTCTATYTATVADIDGGDFTNTATATGTSPLGTAITSGPSSATVQTPDAPALTIAKSASPSDAAHFVPGQKITYSFVVTNTGNVTVKNVGVRETAFSGAGSLSSVSCPPAAASLAAGARVICTATYTIRQADVDAGTLTNEALATGTAPNGSTVTSPRDKVAIPADPAPAITVTKQADATALSSPPAAGDTITYSFSATNSGNVTLTKVAISDPLIPQAGITYRWPGTAGSLLPGETVTATGTYRLTQLDVNAGHVLNTVTGVGTSPQGTQVSGKASADVPLIAGPGLVTTKTADASALHSPATSGDVITYSFTATNTGNVTLTGVTIDDILKDSGLSPIDYVWPGTAGVLNPGQVVTAKATFPVRQLDIDDGHVLNTATSSGNPPSGPRVTSPPVSQDVPLAAASTLRLVKSADASALSSAAKVGETVTYGFTGTNTGNTTLTGVAITDDLVDTAKLVYAWPGAAGVLLPGQSFTAQVPYTLTQQDIDGGHVGNTATASGTPPSGPRVTSPEADTDTPLTAAPLLALLKQADDTALSSPPKAGDTITYRFTGTNAGNVTLTGISITDALIDQTQLVYVWPGADGVLEPGQSFTASVPYLLTQDDVNTGRVVNSATSTGTTPGGDPVISPPSTTDTPLPQVTTLLLNKTADSTALSQPAQAGDTITYQFTGTNTGNVTVTNVAIQDDRIDPTKLTYTWPGQAGTLLPGQTLTATVPYTITQADLNDGHVANTATLTGTPPGGNPVTSPPSDTDTPLQHAISLELTKTADASALPVPARPDGQITYQFTLTNTSNITLTQVEIRDPLIDPTHITYTWPGTDGVLNPGQTVTATAPYGITQTDIDAGHVHNTATGAGTDPNGNETTTNASADVTLPPAPALHLTKSADASALDDPPVPGNIIRYTITGTNTGNVTLTGVTFTDGLDGLSELTYTWPGAAHVLAPGEEATATAEYTLTQADIDAGHVSNTALGTATPPDGPDVTDDGTADLPLPPAPSIHLVKTADSSAVGESAAAGDVVGYRFTATNTGNVTLNDVQIVDLLPRLSGLDYTWPGTAGVLAPGEQVTATATYGLDQADVDAGQVDNTATVTGTPSQGEPVTDESTATVPLARSALISLTKTADGSSLSTPVAVGDPVHYSFVGTNTGNVTLTGVRIVDPLEGLSELKYEWPGEIGVLAPGEQVRATAMSTMRQATIDRGHEANTATVTSNPPAGEPVTAEASADTPLVPAPVIDLTKTADTSGLSSPPRAGDTITYVLTGTNNGNVTLTGVTIRDEKKGLSELEFTWPGAPGVLAPGESVTATATLQLSQSDIDAGHVNNTASAVATDPDGTEIDDEATVDVPVTVEPRLEVVKTADTSAISSAQVGDTITFRFTVTNTGNATVSGISIQDRLPGLSGLVYAWPGTAGVLEPRESATATATYRLTADDLRIGHVANHATATGTPPSGTPLTSPPSEVDIPVQQRVLPAVAG